MAGTNGEPVDDIAFLRALIDHLVADENGDSARAYVAGVSSGGYLAARVACEMGDKVAAVADVIATSVRSVFQSCNPHPVAFALIASTIDDTNPYAGQRGDELTQLALAPETAFFFAGHNRCARRTETPLPHAERDQDSTVSLVRFSGCTDNAEVLFYRVGWEAAGRRNRDRQTAAVLWAFFRAHRLTTGSPAQ